MLNIDISVNKVKSLKLKASSGLSDIYVDWADAKFTGVVQNVSLDEKDILAKSFINTDKLVPGENLTM